MKDFGYDHRKRLARREEECEYLFLSGGPFWHLCTPGTNQEIMFISSEDYGFGVTSAAISLPDTVSAYALAVMSNHLHDILSGNRDDCLDYFGQREKRIRSYLAGTGRKVDLRYFKPDIIPIESLTALRNEIVYVNRNGYVAHPEHTPFSYPWSSGMYYFNPAADGDSLRYSSLSYDGKRAVTHSRLMTLPEDYYVKNGAITIPSFTRIRDGECFFRDAHQYFNLLSRSAEAYSEVAKRLGDQVFLTDDELFSALCVLCRKEFGQPKPSSLSPNDKISMAIRMKKQYAASNGQIRRMLRLDAGIVQELFPE